MFRYLIVFWKCVKAVHVLASGSIGHIYNKNFGEQQCDDQIRKNLKGD